MWPSGRRWRRGHMTPPLQSWPSGPSASLLGSFRAFPSLCFLQGCSPSTSSLLAASSSSCLGPFGVGALWLEECPWHFSPTCGAGVPDTLGVAGAGTNPLPAMACSWAVADIPRMAAKGTLLVRICSG